MFAYVLIRPHSFYQLTRSWWHGLDTYLNWTNNQDWSEWPVSWRGVAGFDSRWERGKNWASRPSQWTVNGVPSLNDLAVDGTKHNQPTNSVPMKNRQHVELHVKKPNIYACVFKIQRYNIPVRNVIFRKCRLMHQYFYVFRDRYLLKMFYTKLCNKNVTQEYKRINNNW